MKTAAPESPRVEYDAEGIAWVMFDDPDSKVNVLGLEQMQRLATALDDLAKRKPKAVIFISAKPNIFIAGADIKELEKIRDGSHGEQLSREGHRVFAKIEELGVPTVAAIDGACLGGGCELALACRYRVATDSPKTQIGLPETQLGIIPGWGGSQRLPRLIGLPAALDIICAGQTPERGQSAADRLGGCGGADGGVARDGDKIGVQGRRAPEERAEGATAEHVAAAPDCLSAWHGSTCWRVPRASIRPRCGRLRRWSKGSRARWPTGWITKRQSLAKSASLRSASNLLRVFFLREKYAKLVFNAERADAARGRSRRG